MIIENGLEGAAFQNLPAETHAYLQTIAAAFEKHNEQFLRTDHNHPHNTSGAPLHNLAARNTQDTGLQRLISPPTTLPPRPA
jgi:hypothetical protein